MMKHNGLIEVNKRMKESQMEAHMAFSDLVSIISRLRAPNGCPWDREQTIASLLPSLIEESYEFIDASTNGDIANQREELGDLYLVLTMIATIAQEEGLFSLQSVLKENCDKLIRRHPHVFGDVVATSSQEVVRQWEEIKKAEKGSEKHFLDKIKKSLPPLERSAEILRKVEKNGFAWKSESDILAKVHEETVELQNASSSADKEEEWGDLILSLVSWAERQGINPQLALNKANEKFIRRYKKMETHLAERNLTVDQTPQDELLNSWSKT